MREALVTGMMALLLVCGSASCSSPRPPPLARSWEEPFEAVDSGGTAYDAKTLAEKWRELDALRAELPELDARIAALGRSFRFRPLPEISPDLSNQASRVMARSEERAMPCSAKRRSAASSSSFLVSESEEIAM